jgi:hypothetical protein
MKRAHLSCHVHGQQTSLLSPKLSGDLIDLPIEAALQHVGKIDNQQFVEDCQKMLFKVSALKSNKAL